MATRKNNTWDITISIPFEDIALYLTDDEYDSVKDSITDSVHIKLSYDYTPADREVGYLSDSMDFLKWDWADTTYSATIEKAINLYIAETDIEDRYAEKVLEKRNDYAYEMAHPCFA
jgi:lipoprotein NlpI